MMKSEAAIIAHAAAWPNGKIPDALVREYALAYEDAYEDARRRATTPGAAYCNSCQRQAPPALANGWCAECWLLCIELPHKEKEIVALRSERDEALAQLAAERERVRRMLAVVHIIAYHGEVMSDEKHAGWCAAHKACADAVKKEAGEVKP